MLAATPRPIPLRQAIPLGMQHVLAMFVGNLTPLMIICGICGITAEQPALYVTLLQNAMLAAGVITPPQSLSRPGDPLPPAGTVYTIISDVFCKNHSYFR